MLWINHREIRAQNIYISYGIGTSYNSWVDFIAIYFVGIDKDYNVKPLLVVIVGGINK